MVFIFFTHDESAFSCDDDPLSAQPLQFVLPCDDAYDDQQQIHKVLQVT
jgi:hypothetical protein